MKRFLLSILLACLAALASPAFAETLTARQGDDSVRLMDQPCTHEQVITRIEPGSLHLFRAATARFQGADYVACWRVMGNVAVLVYEDGDHGIIPMQELKPEVDV